MSVKDKEQYIEQTVPVSADPARPLSAAWKEPQWMLDFRLAAWALFETMEWPKSTEEAWRRTKLTGFDLKNFQPVVYPNGHLPELGEIVKHELDEMDSAASLVFADGMVAHRAAQSDLASHHVTSTALQNALKGHL